MFSMFINYCLIKWIKKADDNIRFWNAVEISVLAGTFPFWMLCKVNSILFQGNILHQIDEK